ncbi:MAG: sigma-54 dependent transcriptional regulator [Myxococcota bacterium]|nr:sigma-54 dependent transcriptional regulator [Myxococcota bacterium]
MTQQVLIVDDREGIRSFIADVLTGIGLETTTAADGVDALNLLKKRHFHLLITDLKMPRMDGMALLRAVRAEQPEIEVIVLTAHGSIESAVEAMKIGAFDYLAKPLSSPDELRLLVQKALEHQRLRTRQVAIDADQSMVAVDPVMIEVKTLLHKVAATDATVLLTGESGSGKEVAAREIHRTSSRKEAPFVAVNCAAISPELTESEMFGHEKGAFTGANEPRRGRFELADGGTLFLDEIGELPLPLQAKLLRVLQDKRFERVGGVRTHQVDVRVIAATNRRLTEEIAAGRFREDLFHRLSVFPIHLPPLRERPQDVLSLSKHLLAIIGSRLNRPGLMLSAETEKQLLSHNWPGNVRELSNVLERAAILAETDAIAPAQLLLFPAGKAIAASALATPWGTLKEMEKQAIRTALAKTGGHRKKAAQALGIGLRTLYTKLKEYNLD